MSIKLSNPNPETPIPDENNCYLKAACAEWTRGILNFRRRLDRETVEFLFWIAGDDSSRLDALCNILMSEADKIRLSADIRRAWGIPDELASIAWMAVGQATIENKQIVVRQLDSLLLSWTELRQKFAGSSLALHLMSSKKTFGLSDLETEFCFFQAAFAWHKAPQYYFNNHLDCEQSSGRASAMAALGWDHATMGAVMNGKAHKIGIIEQFGDRVVIDDNFTAFFIDPDGAPDTQDLFRTPLSADMPANTLGVREADLDLVKRLLVGDSDKPTHILLYGPPGTGKTTLARALIDELDLQGLETMGIEDNMSRSRRASLAVCLEMAKDTRDSIVLIDEADKILGTNLPWFAQWESMDKGWLTRILDESTAHTIWIVNERDNIDPAVLRRFTFSLEMPLPGLSVRRTILDKILRKRGIKRFFSDQNIETLVRDYPLAPAIFDNAAALSARAGGNPSAHRDAFRQTLDATLKLMGSNVQGPREIIPPEFLEDGVNPTGGLETLRTRAKAYDRTWSGHRGDVPAMAMLFHGAPGTGKTVTARHLAKMLDREVISRRASDLLGMYVGQSEANVAAAFSEAASSGAILLLDEIDSFLQPRAQAHRHWETTLVNEMLVQLESHRGLVIATTNRLKGLDPAALRRFTVKTEFRHLDFFQVQSVYVSLLSPLARGPVTPEVLLRLEVLDNITTADMDIIRKNHLLLGRGRVSHDDLLDELEAEVGVKRSQRTTPIGFQAGPPELLSRVSSGEQNREVPICR